MPTWGIALVIVAVGVLVLILTALSLLRRLGELKRAVHRVRGDQTRAQTLQADVAALQQRLAGLAQQAETVTSRVARPRDTT